MTTQLTPEVTWTGVVDWSLRMFHSYAVPDGVTYNSYLIQDEQLTLVDTVKSSYASEFVHKLQQVVKIEDLKYLISLHAEPDHSGCIPTIFGLNPEIVIVCSTPAQEILKTIYPQLKSANFMTVTNDSTLIIGKNTLKFRMTPMQHWPESMGCSMGDILFSSDFFGQHLASTERYVDDFDVFRVIMRMEDYAANIMNPFMVNVTKTIQYYVEQNYQHIFPAHGLCFQFDNCKVAFEVYQKFVDQKVKQNKVVVVYDSMYGSTTKAAQIVAQGILSKGFEPVLLNAETSSNAEIAYALFKSRALCVGSATLNNQMMPDLDAILTYAGQLQHLKGMKFCAFGGCCWAGTALTQIVNKLNEFGAECVGQFGWILKCDDQQLQHLFELGQKIVEALE
ncbi:A-type_flavoprotein 6 [Hexamita inflata]|uniref:A-type_flavoprotein 6 n=1 Tax=Hexamita inflata TaxID=28002 RepID=A0ABP1H4T3_9EUKA